MKIVTVYLYKYVLGIVLHTYSLYPQNVTRIDWDPVFSNYYRDADFFFFLVVLCVAL